MLSTTSPAKMDILALQEPWKNAVNFYSTATPGWTSVYPSTHAVRPAETRSLLLIASAISTNCWSEIQVDSPDITAVNFTTERGNIWIFNVYLDGDSDEALGPLKSAIRQLKSENPSGTPQMIWAGDFNRHHPAWDAPENHHLFSRRNLDAAERLIAVTEQHNMVISLPPGTPTLCALSTGNLTRPDQVFVSANMEDAIIKCATQPDRQPTKVDHYPILTELDTTVSRTSSLPRRDFRKVDWEKFNEVLQTELVKSPAPIWIENAGELDQVHGKLSLAMLTAIEQCVPEIRPTPYRKRWWSEELTVMWKEKRRIQRRAASYRSRGIKHECIEIARRVRNELGRAIEKAKKDHWEQFLDEALIDTVHNTARYTKGAATDGGRVRIPAIQTHDGTGLSSLVRDNEAKSKVFFDAFFVKSAPLDQLQIPSSTLR